MKELRRKREKKKPKGFGTLKRRRNELWRSMVIRSMLGGDITDLKKQYAELK